MDSLNSVADKLGQKLENTFGVPVSSIKSFASELGTASKAINSTSKETIKSASANKIWTNSTLGMSKAQKAFIIATNLGSKALKLFRIALISTGIGVIVVGIISLVAAMTKSQPVIDKVRAAFAAVGAAVSVVVDRLADIGGAIFEFVSGEISLSQALGKIQDSFKGVGDEIIRETRLAKDLEDQLIALEQASLVQSAASTKARAEIQRLNATYQDVNVSLEEQLANQERIKEILEDVSGAEARLARERIANALGLEQVGEKSEAITESLRDLENLQLSTTEKQRIFNDVLADLGISKSQTADFEELIGLVNSLTAAEQQQFEGVFRSNQRIVSLSNKIQQDKAKQLKDEAERAQAYIDLEQSLNDEIQTLQIERGLNNIKNAEERAQRVLQLEFESNKKKLEAQKFTGDQLTEQQKAINQQIDDLILENEITLQEDLSDIRLAAQQERINREFEAAQKIGELRLNELEEGSREYVSREIELLQARMAKILENDELLAIEREAIELEYQQKIDAIREEFAEKDKERNIDKLNDFAQKTGEISSEISGLWSSINQIQANADQRQLDSLKERLDAELISQEQYDQKVKQIQVQQARRERGLAVFEATINTFTAFTNALKQDPPFNAIFAATALASGLAKVAAIQSQPLPSFGDGGEIKGRSHKQGGVDINAEGGEYMINKKAYSENPHAAKALNSGDFDKHYEQRFKTEKVFKIEQGRKERKKDKRKRGVDKFNINNVSQLGKEIARNIQKERFTLRR